jgi:hypothetical protein
MLKIVTDPTAGWPLLEADLSQSEGQLAVTPVPEIQSRDFRFTTSTGGSNVIFRKRRMRYMIPIDWIDYAKFQDILRIVERRVPVYLFPNFDRATLLDSPLQSANISDGLPYYWRKDPATQLPTRTAATFTRSTSNQWYQDAGGRFQQVAANTPRFIPGPFGRGVIQENGPENLAANPHPTSGALGWIAGALPALAPIWEPNILSPVISKLGCARLPYDADAALTATWAQFYSTGQSAAGKFRSISLWLLGDAEIGVSAVINGADVDTVTGIRLRMDRWTEVPIMISPKASVGNALVITLFVVTPDSSGNVYAGPLMDTDGLQANNDRPAPAMWNEAGNTTEILRMDCPIAGATYSIAWMGFVPQRLGNGAVASTVRCWGVDGAGVFPASAVPRCEFRVTGVTQILRANLNTGETIEVVIPTSAAGQPYYASLVVDTAKTDGTARIYFRSGDLIASEEQEGRPDFVGARLNSTFLEVGNSEGVNIDQWPGRMALSHFRVDQRAWSVAEQDLHARLYSEGSFQSILATCLGRRFWIRSVDLHPREDRWNDIVGSITVEELDDDPALVVVAT